MNTDLTPAPTPRTDAVINATRDERGVYDELDRMTALAKSLERELEGDRKEVIELYEQAHMEVEFCDSNEFSMTQEISAALSMLGQANKDLSGALREEQLKTQALTADLIICRQIRDNHECAMRAMDAVYDREKARLDWLDRHCAFVADPEFNIGPYKVGELRNMADDGIKQSAALAGEQPTRP